MMESRDETLKDHGLGEVIHSFVFSSQLEEHSGHCLREKNAFTGDNTQPYNRHFVITASSCRLDGQIRILLATPVVIFDLYHH